MFFLLILFCLIFYFLRREKSAEFRIFMASSDETPKTQAAREQFLTLDLKVRLTIFDLFYSSDQTIINNFFIIVSPQFPSFWMIVRLKRKRMLGERF